MNLREMFNLQLILFSLMNAVGERIMNVNHFIGPIYRFSKAYRVHQKASEVCNGFTHRIVQKRRFEIQTLGENFHQKDEYIKQSLNSLDQIITIKKQDGSGFSDTEVNEHLYSLIGAVRILIGHHKTDLNTFLYDLRLMILPP